MTMRDGPAILAAAERVRFAYENEDALRWAREFLEDPNIWRLAPAPPPGGLLPRCERDGR